MKQIKGKKSLVGYIRPDWYKEFRYPRGGDYAIISELRKFGKGFYFDKYRKKKVRITIEEL